MTWGHIGKPSGLRLVAKAGVRRAVSEVCAPKEIASGPDPGAMWSWASGPSSVAALCISSDKISYSLLCGSSVVLLLRRANLRDRELAAWGWVSLATISLPWCPSIQVQGGICGHWHSSPWSIHHPGPLVTLMPDQQSLSIRTRDTVGLLACWVVLCLLPGPGSLGSNVHFPPQSQWSSSLNFTGKAIPTLESILSRWHWVLLGTGGEFFLLTEWGGLDIHSAPCAALTTWLCRGRGWACVLLLLGKAERLSSSEQTV